MAMNAPVKQVGISAIVLIAVIAGAVSWNNSVSPRASVDSQGVHHFTVWMRNWYFVPNHIVWYPGEKVALTLVNESQLVPRLNEQFTAGKELLRAPPGNALGYGNPLGWGEDLFTGVQLRTSSGAFTPHGAFALTLSPGKSSTIRFTVPDKPGAWCYTSFLQAGFQYMNDMVGMIVIKPSKGSATPHYTMIGASGVCGQPAQSPIPYPVKPSPSGVGTAGLGQS